MRINNRKTPDLFGKTGRRFSVERVTWSRKHKEASRTEKAWSIMKMNSEGLPMRSNN